MKKSIFLFVFLLGLSLGSTYAQRKSNTDKANQKRTIGFILLGSGAAMITAALVTDLSDDSPVLLTAGGLTTLASVPFFISAAKYGRRGRIISGLMEVQQLSASIHAPPVAAIPTLKLRINL